MMLAWLSKGLLFVFLVLLCVVVYQFWARGLLSQEMNPELGLVDGQFRPCSTKPNCVNSFSSEEGQAIPAIVGGSIALAKLAAFIAETENANIRVLAENYVWATYQSGLFGFVDDVELYFDGTHIQVRSASRVGHSDFGANRKRVEALRDHLTGHY